MMMMMRVVALLLAASAAASCATPRQEEKRERIPPRDEPPLVIIIEPAEPKDRPPKQAPPDAPPRDAPRDAPPRDAPPRDEPPATVPPDGVLPSLGRGEVPDHVPPEPPGLDRERTMTVHVLDIGQGAATLFEFPCGTILVDTGGELNGDFDSIEMLKVQLDAFFERRKDLKRTIDVLVITHPHIDHVRGIPTLLDKYIVKSVIESGFPPATNVRTEMNRLRDYVAGSKVHRVVLRDDIAATTGFTDKAIDPLKCKIVDPKVRVLSGRVGADPGWKEDKYGKSTFANANNHSVVVRVDFGESSVLVTGDLEEVAIEDLVHKYEGQKPGGLLDVDVYQAGHHGSFNGTTRPLVAAMTPEVAVIQMGAEWRRRSWSAWQYGHPREEVVDQLRSGVSQTREKPRLCKVGVKGRTFAEVIIREAVYGTGWDGPIAIDMNVDGTVVVRPPLK
jgi:competence protein ComEC